MSVDSVHSYNSLSSQQTAATNINDADKKKKRKNWVRCSLNCTNHIVTGFWLGLKSPSLTEKNSADNSHAVVSERI